MLRAISSENFVQLDEYKCHQHFQIVIPSLPFLTWTLGALHHRYFVIALNDFRFAPQLRVRGSWYISYLMRISVIASMYCIVFSQFFKRAHISSFRNNDVLFGIRNEVS